MDNLNEEFLANILYLVKDIQYEMSTIENFKVINYKIQKYDAERKIKVNLDTKHVVVSTESVTLKVRQELISKTIEYVSRINEFLQIGCFELLIDTGVLRYRMAQTFHAETNPQQIVCFFVEQQDIIFPKLLSGVSDVINNNKNPIESAQNFIKPLEIIK